jgi:hypothetical protein
MIRLSEPVRRLTTAPALTYRHGAAMATADDKPTPAQPLPLDAQPLYAAFEQWCERPRNYWVARSQFNHALRVGRLVAWRDGERLDKDYSQKARVDFDPYPWGSVFIGDAVVPGQFYISEDYTERDAPPPKSPVPTHPTAQPGPIGLSAAEATDSAPTSPAAPANVKKLSRGEWLRNYLTENAMVRELQAQYPTLTEAAVAVHEVMQGAPNVEAYARARNVEPHLRSFYPPRKR